MFFFNKVLQQSVAIEIHTKKNVSSPGKGGGRGFFQVSLVPMLEQRIEKHTLNSVLKKKKKKKTRTLFTLFLIKIKTAKNIRYSWIMVPSSNFYP